MSTLRGRQEPDRGQGLGLEGGELSALEGPDRLS